jgi:hypothetical protein
MARAGWALRLCLRRFGWFRFCHCFAPTLWRINAQLLAQHLGIHFLCRATRQRA